MIYDVKHRLWDKMVRFELKVWCQNIGKILFQGIKLENLILQFFALNELRFVSVWYAEKIHRKTLILFF